MQSSPSSTNPMLQLAYDFVVHTNQSIFLTGRAGTGKTTFLKRLRETCPKQMAVLAPTGVAAINAGGTTIHSFFQLPFTPFIPAATGNGAAHELDAQGKHGLLARLRYNRERRQLLQSLDLLVIDEISMVRCDVMDAIDTILQYVRNNAQPFGGVQMLLIGDMYQLPPVVPDATWQVLQEYYTGPFFFDSQVIRSFPPVYVELQTIYRQTDSRFVDLLNAVRNNQLTAEGLSLLNSRYQPDFAPTKNSKYITLTTHNAKADEINASELASLPGQVFVFDATVEGDFSEKNYPAEKELQLKIGAQVMFLKNDVNGRKYYNGKIGVVTHVEDDTIKVKCESDEEPISVNKDVWRNVQYSLNRQLQQVEEQEIGSFTQFPLRLAWAVTIHKSQGLTFSHAIIDAAKAFSPGQVYVALSRCTSLEGLVLHTPVPKHAVFTDSRVQHYASTGKMEEELRQFYMQSRRSFQQQMLHHVFNGERLAKAAAAMLEFLKQHKDAFGESAIPWAEHVCKQILELDETANKFRQQITAHIFTESGMPEDSTWLQERVVKAADWFSTKLEAEVVHAIRNQPAVSDSKEQADSFEQILANVYVSAMQWKQLTSACRKGFNVIEVLQARSKVNIAEIVGTAYAGSSKRQVAADSPHPLLLQKLKQVRDDICRNLNKPVYMVAGTTTLVELAQYLPQSEEELLSITGFGPQKVKQFGERFLTVIRTYCDEQHIVREEFHKEVKRSKKKKEKIKETGMDEPKLASREVSLNLFKSGLTVSEIAAQRSLSKGTIEGHLAHFVLHGELPMQALVSPELEEKIREVFLEAETERVGQAREILGDEASYAQVMLVHDWIRMHEKQ